MKILRLGDPHIKTSNRDEAEKLLQFVVDTAMKYSVNRIEILGDLFHTHAVVRLEVLDFWDHWLDHLADICEVVVLVGNHDMPGNNEASYHSLDVFKRIRKKNLRIIDSASAIDFIGYVPCIHDNDKFVEAANHLQTCGAKILVSHTTYSGSRFESGMYAPGGVDPELLNYPLLISGHIHNRQRYVTNKSQQVIYPGTAKWDTASDANEEKGLWIVDHDDTTGLILAEEYVDTSKVCSPILEYQWKEGDNSPVIPEGSRASIELIGSSEWVNKQKASLKGKASVKSKITDKSRPASRKTGKSLEQFLMDQFEPIAGVDKQAMVNFLKELAII